MRQLFFILHFFRLSASTQKGASLSCLSLPRRQNKAQRETHEPTTTTTSDPQQRAREKQKLITSIMAEADSGADLLWTTRNSFYVGAFQAAVADAADLEGLDDATALERDAFVFRCYVELGSHEVRGVREPSNRLRD